MDSEKDHTLMPQQQYNVKRAFLIIVDGFGLASEGSGNAIALSGMPYVNSLIAEYPAMSIVASSLVVGLPWGQYGNSEVGHSALGAGRIIVQDLSRINNEINNEKFFKNPTIVKTYEYAEKHDSTLHLIGCLSPGGIHSHESHLFALLELAKKRGLKKVSVHVITDGQDTGPQEGIEALKRLAPHLKKSGARIASISGRTFAMDRVMNWELTEKVWHAIVDGDGIKTSDASQYIEESYAKQIFDRDIVPATIVAKTDGDDQPVSLLSDNDAVFFFNFRNDRMKQLVQPFVLKRFDGFDRERIPKDLFVSAMTRYSDEYNIEVAYEALDIKHTLGEIVSDQGWKQYRIAEKEKEAHVTNFFNGGRIIPFPGEERVIVSSRMLKGKEYIEHPEMSAEKIVKAVRDSLSTHARLFVINFANPDMIGHSGDLKAATKACKVVDDSLKDFVPELIAEPESAIIITADHGNAEEMLDPKTGEEDTQHSTFNVPVVFAGQMFAGQGSGKDLNVLANENPLGTLEDIAPTILRLFDIKKPDEMSGSSLL